MKFYIVKWNVIEEPNEKRKKKYTRTEYLKLGATDRHRSHTNTPDKASRYEKPASALADAERFGLTVQPGFDIIPFEPEPEPEPEPAAPLPASEDLFAGGAR